MDKYKKLASDTLLFGISSFASKFLIFFLLPIYTSKLSTVEFGTIDLLYNIVNLIYPLLTLSVAEATLRFAFDKDIKKNEILTVSLFFIFSGAILLFILTPVAGTFGRTMENYWIPFILLFLGYSLQACFSYFCRGANKTRLFAVQGIVQTISTVILNLLFLIKFDLGIKGYLIATISAYYITVLFVIITGGLWKEIINIKFNKKLMIDMLKYSMPMIPSMVAWWINSSVNKYFIISILGIGASGIFSVSNKVPSILSVITEIFNQAWQITAINTYNDDDKTSFYSEINRYFTLMCIFACAILILISELLGKILFADEYFIGWKCIPPLLIAALFASLSGFLATIFRTAKKTNILFLSTCIGATVSIVFNYPFIKIFGLIGAAFATMLSFIIVWISRLVSSMKIVNLKIDFFKTSSSMVLLIIESLVVCNQISYRYIISISIILILLFVNREDIREILSKGILLVKDLKNRKHT